MRKYLGWIITIVSFLIGVVGVRALLTYREEKKSSYENTVRYLETQKKFQGLPTKVKIVKSDTTHPHTITLSQNTWTLLLYFRVDDCACCLKEVKAVKDTFDLESSNLSVLVATDHPVSWEVKYIMQDLSLKEAIWDSGGILLGNQVKYTPTYFLIKGKKIKETGIIGPLKEADSKEGAFSHYLKGEFKKYDF